MGAPSHIPAHRHPHGATGARIHQCPESNRPTQARESTKYITFPSPSVIPLNLSPRLTAYPIVHIFIFLEQRQSTNQRTQYGITKRFITERIASG